MVDKIITPALKQYSIQIDYLVPTTITYKITAENEQEALKQIDKAPLSNNNVKHNLQRKIKLKAKVFQAGTSMVKLTKIYRQF